MQTNIYIKETTNTGRRRGVSIQRWGLAVAVAFLGCGRAGSIVETACVLGEEEACPSGYVCLAVAGLAEGSGICVPEEYGDGKELLTCPPGQNHWATGGGIQCLPENTCKLDEANACQPGHLCWATADRPEGLGACVPDNSCTLESNAWQCPQADYKCQDSPNTPPGLGTCVPESCTLGDNTQCPDNWVCLDTTEASPGRGACVPEGSCTLESGAECEVTQLCLESSNTPPGIGSCVPPNSCTLGNATECSLSELCLESTNTPPGIGTCVDDNSCPLGSISSCDDDKICLEDPDKPDGIGSCVPPDSCLLSEAEACEGTDICLNSTSTPPSIGSCVPEDSCTLPGGTECDGDKVCIDNPNIPGGIGTCSDRNSCTLDGSTPCASGEICLSTNPSSGIGLCVPGNTCILSTGAECGPGEVCLNSGNTPEGMGTCVTDESCTLESGSECDGAQLCLNSSSTPPGIGSCVPPDSCTLGSTTECASGQLCLNDLDKPDGIGTCLPEGNCTLGSGAECSGTQLCLDSPSTPPGIGLCVPDNSCTLGSTTECATGQICLNDLDKPEGIGTCVSDDSCTLSTGAECTNGEICLKDTDTPPGIGTCVPDDSCTLESGAECSTGQICLSTTGAPPGLGTCVPDNSCTLESGTECGSGYICLNATGTLPGLGTCVPDDSCTLESGTECTEGQLCLNDLDKPDGIGTCVRDDSCTLSTGTECDSEELCLNSSDTPPGVGTCVPEDSCTLSLDECTGGEICLNSSDTPPGLGSCVPPGSCILGQGGCASNEACEEVGGMPPGLGTCVQLPGVVSWRLLQGGNEVEAEEGWLGSGTGLVELTARTAGNLIVWSEAGGSAIAQASCQVVQPLFWECTFGAGFAGAGPEVEVWVQLGAEAAQSKTYNVATQTPAVTFTLTGTNGNAAEPGDAITLCAHAEARPAAPSTSVAIHNNDIYSQINDDKTFLVNTPLVWTHATNTATSDCWNTTLHSNIAEGMLAVTAQVTVMDTLNNTLTTQATGYLNISPRIKDQFSTGIPGTVALAWTNNQLVVGVNNEEATDGYVYFYSPSTRSVLASSPHMGGPLTGLTTLGDSGRVAISTSGANGRVTLVDGSGNFVDSSGNMDCRRGVGSVGGSANFPHGLTWLSMGNSNGTGNWSFAVPVNESAQGRLLTYSPNGNPQSNCILSNAFASGGVLLPVVGRQSSELWATHGVNPIRAETCGWNGSTWACSASGFSSASISPSLSFAEVLGVAVDDTSFWLTAKLTNGRAKAIRYPIGGSAVYVSYESDYASFDAASSPVLDATGRAFVVTRRAGGEAMLTLYRSNMGVGISIAEASSTLPYARALSVGGPILGQRTGTNYNTEAYVVTTDGKVFAYSVDAPGTDFLALLWSQALLDSKGQPISVAPTAYPVLRGNRLWIVSTEGELYSLEVASNGLHQSARWPRIHHDNCNSNTRLATNQSAPGCF